MAEFQFPTCSIEFGPGGEIKNPELLEHLENTPILQPREVLRLAINLVGSPTNDHLGHSLWEYALESIVRNPVIAQDIQNLFAIDIVKYAEDFWDEFFDIPSDSEDEGAAAQYYIYTVVNGIGLLVEKRVYDTGVVAYYAANFITNPNKLQEPEKPENLVHTPSK